MNTLAHGATIQSKWEGLGGQIGATIAPLSGSTILILGQPGEGKSHLLHDCPDSYVLNPDVSSTSNPQARAAVWPSRSSDTGLVIGDNGRPIILSASDIFAKVDRLVALAREGKPRPRVVGIDSLSSLMHLIKIWMPHNANTIGLTREPVQEWNQLNGLAAYDWLYDRIVGIVQDLQRAGYGVAVIAHVVNSVIQLDDNKSVIKPELTVTSGFWKRFYRLFDTVVAVSKKTESKTLITPGTVMVKGKAVPTRKKELKNITTYTLAVTNPQLDGLTKKRVSFPDSITLPALHPWDVFEAEYEKARQRDLSGIITDSSQPADSEEPDTDNEQDGGSESDAASAPASSTSPSPEKTPN